MNFECIDDLYGFLTAEKQVDNLNIEPDICPPEMDGDITVNCFRFARILQQNPMELAGKVAEFFGSHADVEKVEAIKAFVNITLKAGALHRDSIADLDKLLGDAVLPEGTKKRILIEYSAPNTNKPQHLGHVRNNTLGMSLVSLMKRIGHDVIPINLVNDRGIHICKSMVAYQRFGEGVTPESSGKKGDHLVGDFYVKYDQELKAQLAALREEKPELKDESDDDLFLKNRNRSSCSEDAG